MRELLKSTILAGRETLKLKFIVRIIKLGPTQLYGNAKLTVPQDCQIQISDVAGSRHMIASAANQSRLSALVV